MFRTLSYSNHARARLIARGIFKKQVRRTVRRPDNVYSRGQDHLAEYATSSGTLVRVIYRLVPEEQERQVISAVRLGRSKGALQTAATGTVYDPLFDVAYVALLSGRIAETTEVAEGVYYDLDPYGEIVGAEIFGYSRFERSENEGLSILERLPIPAY